MVKEQKSTLTSAMMFSGSKGGHLQKNLQKKSKQLLIVFQGNIGKKLRYLAFQRVLKHSANRNKEETNVATQ